MTTVLQPVRTPFVDGRFDLFERTAGSLFVWVGPSEARPDRIADCVSGSTDRESVARAWRAAESSYTLSGGTYRLCARARLDDGGRRSPLELEVPAIDADEARAEMTVWATGDLSPTRGAVVLVELPTGTHRTEPFAVEALSATMESLRAEHPRARLCGAAILYAIGWHAHM